MPEERRIARRLLLWGCYIAALAIVLFIPYAFKTVPLAILGKRVALLILAGLAIGIFLALRIRMLPPGGTKNLSEPPRERKRIRFPSE